MTRKWLAFSAFAALFLGLTGLSGAQASDRTDVLLFAGDGAWSPEVASLEEILTERQLTYRPVSSAELDAMSVDEMASYGVIVWPGGSGGTQARSLSAQTHANLRAAVQERGVSYIGFCAGAFVGIAPAPKPGEDVSYGLGIVDGPELGYYHLENEISPDIAMTKAVMPDGSQRDLLWYGGPVTPNTGVVAKYDNGDPMISQMTSGKGFVILVATHPAAPQDIRDEMALQDSDGLDYDYAFQLIDSALKRQLMPQFPQ